MFRKEQKNPLVELLKHSNSGSKVIREPVLTPSAFDK